MLPGQPARPDRETDREAERQTEGEDSSVESDDALVHPRASVGSDRSDASSYVGQGLTMTRSRAPADQLVADSTEGICKLPRWVAGWDDGWSPAKRTGYYLQRTLVGGKPGDGTGKHMGEPAYIPFVASKAEQVLIRGELDADVAAEALRPQGLFPILTRGGRAVGTVNINKIESWSLKEPYQEIVFALDATKEQGVVIPEPCGARLCCCCCCCSQHLRRWSLGYVHFSTVVPGTTNFVHSLFVSNSFACDASRQTQAFPKHPTIVEPIVCEETQNNPGALSISVTAGVASVVEGSIKNRWPCCCGVCGGSGCCMSGQMACGFLCSFGLCPLLKLLCSKHVSFAAAHPAECAVDQDQPVAYQYRIRKGLSPFATRVWPCDAGDRLNFGAAVPTPPGLPEENNGQVLFARGNFQPLLVTHLPQDSFSVAAPGRAAPLMEMERGAP